MTGFFIFLTIVGLIVAFILIILSNSKIKKQSDQINRMQQQISKLWYNNTTQPQAEPKAVPSEVSPVVSAVQQPIPRPTLVTPQTVQPSAPLPQAYTAQPATQTHTQSYQPQVSDQSNQAPHLNTHATETSYAEKSSAENWIGRNVLGIAASVLIFIGLIFLGVMIYDYLTDGIKILLMFSISGLITAVGIFLCIKKRNTFTSILTGCGCGSVFISVLLTHIYFFKISDVTAFAILLVWMAAALFLAKKLNSTLISVVSHIGMVFSVCFAYTLGLSQEKLIVIIIYQLASTAVIIAGNLLCCKKTYSLGLIISLALTVFSSSFIWIILQPFGADALPLWLTIVSFSAQFICASVLSLLLSLSVCKMKSVEVRYVLHVLNKLLWISAFSLNLYILTYNLGYHHIFTDSDLLINLSSIYLSVVVGFVVIIIHSAISIFLGKKAYIKRGMEVVSVLLLSGIVFVLLLVLWISQQFDFSYALLYPQLILLLIPAALLMLAKTVSRNKAYQIAANVFLSLDFIFMLVNGFSELTQFGTIALSIGYMLIYPASLWLQWLKCNASGRIKYSMPVRLISYLLIEISLTSVLLSSSLVYGGEILLFTLSALTFLLFIFKYGKGLRAVHITLRINEWLFIVLNATCVGFVYKDDISYYLHIALFVITVLLSLAQVKENFFSYKIKAHEEFLIMLKLTALISAFVYAYIDLPEYKSAVFMLTIMTLNVVFYILRHFLYRYHGLALSSSKINVLMLVIENILVGGGILFIAFSSKQSDVSVVLCLLLTAMTAFLAFVRSKNIFTAKSTIAEELLYGIKLTGLVIAIIFGFTSWFDSSFVFSLILMLTALICIIAGFICRAKALRLYGLVLTLLCVLKLVTVDVAGLESYLRVITLIIGGIICFIASAIYSYSVKKIDVRQK